jgi:hypothetical protein
VEGFEKQVLEGSLETLKRNDYPKILFESWHEGFGGDDYPSTQLRADLFAFLDGLGYRIVPIDGNADTFLAEHRSHDVMP